MLPLGFVIFPCLVFLIYQSLEKKSILNLFFNGFLFGFGFLIIYLSWIQNPFFVYESTKPYAFLAIILPIFLSIFFGLSFIIYRYFYTPLLLILVTPFVFTLIEFSISNFIWGFPWFTNSLILSNNFLGFYLLKYFGTIASGYLIISIFLIFIFLFYNYKNSNFNKLGYVLFSPLIFIVLIPFLSSFYNNKNATKEISIEIHQILNPIIKINSKKIEENIELIINESNSDLVVFAENNFPYLIDKKNFTNLIKFIKKDKKVIIGGTTIEEGKFYNSFLMLEKDKIDIFDKQILVPFGEFLPLRKYLLFMEKISGNIDFQKGILDRFILTKDKLSILPIICYEIIFDKIFNNINEKEIDILINITNDSWFGNKIGPYQHFYIARTKSLIANKPLLRVSNNGISGIIDNNGKIIKFSQLNQISNLTHKLKINKNKSYFYFHKLLSYYILIIFIILVIIRRKSPSDSR